MDMRELRGDIKKRMDILDVSAKEMAKIAGVSDKTWYLHMNNLEDFKFGQIIKFCNFIGIKITYEVKGGNHGRG